jgi:hypothetical protein
LIVVVVNDMDDGADEEEVIVDCGGTSGKFVVSVVAVEANCELRRFAEEELDFESSSDSSPPE